jgi:hypothetical protein
LVSGTDACEGLLAHSRMSGHLDGSSNKRFEQTIRRVKGSLWQEA